MAIATNVLQYGIDNRRLGGEYSVDQNARVLTRFRDAEFHSMLAMMTWMARVGEGEWKKEIGRHTFDDAVHADQLRSRLMELRRSPKRQMRSTAPFRAFLWKLEQAPDGASFLAGVYRVLKPKLISAYHYHIQRTDSVADAPTVKLLERFIADHERHIRQMDAAIQMMAADADAARRVSRWVQELEDAFSDSGGLVNDPSVEVAEDGGDAAIALAEEAPFFTTEPFGARDPKRFRRCTHREAVEHVRALGPREKLMWQWHQQSDNELMAGEFGGQCARENLDMPWEFFMDMARLAWDEVRHTEIFEKRLEEFGGYLGMYPILPGNFAYRFSLPYAVRAADLHLMGEARGQLGLLAHRDTHQVFGDALSSKMFDYIHADEEKHVFFGRKWVTGYLLGDVPGKTKSVLEDVENLRAIWGEIMGVPFVRHLTAQGEASSVTAAVGLENVAQLLKELYPERVKDYEAISAQISEALKRPLD